MAYSGAGADQRQCVDQYRQRQLVDRFGLESGRLSQQQLRQQFDV